MPLLQTIAERWPLPSVRELEASHFELQNGPYPEFAAFDEKTLGNTEPSKLEQQAAGSIGWLSKAFARSPKAINDKREALMQSSRECSSGRSSSDVESQTSTLLESEPEERKSQGRIDPRVISDAIIGLSDGLTVPFALTAGLSALGNTKVVIFAGLAELTAGAISMGLGGYLGAKSEE
jgi:vacuolar iron transporter family protein